MEAVKRAQALEVVEGKPDGLDTMINEGEMCIRDSFGTMFNTCPASWYLSCTGTSQEFFRGHVGDGAVLLL